MSAGLWGWLRGSGRQAQGRELLQSIWSEGAHSAFLEMGRHGQAGQWAWAMADFLGGMLAHMPGLLRLMVPWLAQVGEGWGGHGGSCLSAHGHPSDHVEEHQHQGSSECPGHAELERGVRSPQTLCVCCQ